MLDCVLAEGMTLPKYRDDSESHQGAHESHFLHQHQEDDEGHEEGDHIHST